MQVTVTAHAVEQYQRKMFSTISEHEVKKTLELIATRGEIVHRNPSLEGCFYTVRYNGLYALVRYFRDEAVVVTFLGDKTYRGWYRTKKSDERRRVAT